MTHNHIFHSQCSLLCEDVFVCILQSQQVWFRFYTLPRNLHLENQLVPLLQTLFVLSKLRVGELGANEDDGFPEMRKLNFFEVLTCFEEEIVGFLSRKVELEVSEEAIELSKINLLHAFLHFLEALIILDVLPGIEIKYFLQAIVDQLILRQLLRLALPEQLLARLCTRSWRPHALRAVHRPCDGAFRGRADGLASSRCAVSPLEQRLLLRQLRFFELLDLRIELVDHQLDALLAVEVLDLAAGKQLLAVGNVVEEVLHQIVHWVRALLVASWRCSTLRCEAILQVYIEVVALVHHDHSVASEVLRRLEDLVLILKELFQSIVELVLVEEGLAVHILEGRDEEVLQSFHARWISLAALLPSVIGLIADSDLHC